MSCLVLPIFRDEMAHIDKEKPEKPEKPKGHGVCPDLTRGSKRSEPHEPDEKAGLCRLTGGSGLGVLDMLVCRHCRCLYSPEG